MNSSERRRIPRTRSRAAAIFAIPFRPLRPVTALVLGAAAAATQPEARVGSLRPSVSVPAPVDDSVTRKNATQPEARVGSQRQSVSVPAPVDHSVTRKSAGGMLVQVSRLKAVKPTNKDDEGSLNGQDPAWGARPGTGQATRRRSNSISSIRRRFSIWGSNDKGYWVRKDELVNINSIDCLKAKIKNPAVDCVGWVPGDRAWNPPWSVSNYPPWQHPSCNSGGEYFCDPDNALVPELQAKISAKLRKMRESVVVDCDGGPDAPDTAAKAFFLGVAIAKDFPAGEADMQSLQSFGLTTMARWGMEGVGQVNYASCPNFALLVVLPREPQVYLASPSCMFICKEKGGPFVHSTVLQSMDGSGPGLQSAIFAGIDTVTGFVRTANEANQWQSGSKLKGWSETDVSEDGAAWVMRTALLCFVLMGILTVVFFVINALFPAFAHDWGIGLKPYAAEQSVWHGA